MVPAGAVPRIFGALSLAGDAGLLPVSTGGAGAARTVASSNGDASSVACATDGVAATHAARSAAARSVRLRRREIVIRPRRLRRREADHAAFALLFDAPGTDEQGGVAE